MAAVDEGATATHKRLVRAAVGFGSVPSHGVALQKIHGRSIVTGVIWVVLGMFGTAGYFNSEALGSPFRRKIPTSPIDPGFREQTAQACANA